MNKIDNAVVATSRAKPIVGTSRIAALGGFAAAAFGRLRLGFGQLPAIPQLATSMALPALAGSTAVLFTHPLELTKIRLQLDNELASAGTARKYSGWLDCVRKNWRQGGVRGLQSGVSFGVGREFFFNGIRIGSYEPLVGAVHRATGRKGEPRFDEKMAAGLTAGALGGFFINPIDICKTRMQALGGLTGHQHVQQGDAGVLRSILREEGVRGLTRGVGVNTLRGFTGPGSQIVAYHALKDHLATSTSVDTGSPLTHVGCSLASGAVSIAFVNPVDVVRTRLFNQPFDAAGRGLWYRGGADALAKIVRVEGPLALYKGAGSHYMRLGPHMVLVFVTLEQLKKLRAEFGGSR